MSGLALFLAGVWVGLVAAKVLLLLRERMKRRREDVQYIAPRGGDTRGEPLQEGDVVSTCDYCTMHVWMPLGQRHGSMIMLRRVFPRWESARLEEILMMKHHRAALAIMFFWYFGVSYAGGNLGTWLLMSPPQGPFATKEQCEALKASLTPDPRFTNAKATECWDAGPLPLGPVQLGVVPTYQ